MAVLPESNMDISNGIVFRDYPSYTFYADPLTNRITENCDGYTAVKQTIEIILDTERFYWQIYSPNFGMQWNGLIGQEYGYVASELQRRIKDAFSADNRITGISDFKYTVDNENIVAVFNVNTVYGSVEKTLTVAI